MTGPTDIYFSSNVTSGVHIDSSGYHSWNTNFAHLVSRLKDNRLVYGWCYYTSNFMQKVSFSIDGIDSLPDLPPSPYGNIEALEIAATSDSGFVVSTILGDNGGPHYYRIYKINKNCAIDSSFGTNGYFQYSSYNYGTGNTYPSNIIGDGVQNQPVIVDALGNIYVTGCNPIGQNTILKYNANGQPDVVFNSLYNNINPGINIQPRKLLMNYDGSFIIVSHSAWLAKFKGNGLVDSSFGVNGLVTPPSLTSVESAYLMPDGKIVVAIHTCCFGGVQLRKYNSDGSLNPWSISYDYRCCHNNYQSPIFSTEWASCFSGNLISVAYMMLQSTYCPENNKNFRIKSFNCVPCASGNVPADLPQLSITTNPICSNQPAKLKITGNLNNASQWVYYTNYSSGIIPIYGDSVFLNPTQTTTYYVWGQGACAANGPIDSVTILVLPINYSNDTVSLCANQLPYYWNGQNLVSSGAYTYTTQNMYGCDSILTLALVVKDTSNSTTNVSVCSNLLPYFWNGQSLSGSGTYTFTTNNSVGCDSTVLLNLETPMTYEYNSYDTVCDGQSIFWHGQNYSNSGIYYDSLVSSSGCDSIWVLHLVVYNVDTSVSQNGNILTSNAFSAGYQWVSCPGYVPMMNDTLQSFIALNSGTYAVILTMNGCTDTSSCYMVLSLGISNANSQEDIVVFPNPASSEIFISVRGSAKANFTLYNIFGESLFSKHIDANIFNKKILLPDYLSNGLYFYRCSFYNSCNDIVGKLTISR